MARILVIDDSPFIRQSLAICLPSLGHSVTVAADGETGLIKADAESVDVVLLDVELPRMTGIEICAVLTRGRHRRHLPVLMMTGRPSPEVEERARAAGAVVLLSKPFSLDQLQEALNRHLPAGV